MKNKGSAEKELIERVLLDTRVCLVVEVIECDPDEMTVAVKPLVNDRKMSETGREVEYEEQNTIFNVPLPDVAGIRFFPPIGEHGLVVFHDTDLDGYKLSRAASNPGTSRFHDFNDAIFFPMETAQTGRPEPYATLDGRQITIHTKTVIEKDVKIDGNLIVVGDVQAGTNQASLLSLNTAYNAHTHTVFGITTSTAAPPSPVGTAVFVPFDEVPKVG